jgi:chemotaxis signal transduction protein
MAAFNSSNPSDSPTAAEVEIINFQLGEAEFACDLGQASSFALYQEIQDRPGLLISDLQQSLFSRPHPLQPDTRMILWQGGGKTHAFPVTKINGIFKVPSERIFSPPPSLRESISHPGLIGFALVKQQVVLLLDLEKTIAYLANQTDDAGKN